MHSALLESGHANLLDLLDRLLETGVAVDGEIDLSVADINLIHLGLKLVLASSTTLEQHNNGGAAFADATGNPPGGPSRECSISSALRPGPPILTEAQPQAALVVQPAYQAEVDLDSRPVPAQEHSGERVISGIDRFDGTRWLPANADVKPLPKIDTALAPTLPNRVKRCNFDPAKVERGLAKLVLTLVELLRRLMERQAIRKMEGGTLNEVQVEGLGEAFRRLETKMGELKCVFGLEDEELNIDLGPLGALM